MTSTAIRPEGAAMSTTTAPPPGAAVSTAGRGSRRGRIRLIIVGSLLTGAVLAVVLPLLVFAGTTESAVTGSALLGFAIGWATLAVLTARMTDQPQQWAWISAAWLGATGLGLLLTAPDDRMLTAAGWLWPPLMLVLAAWIGIQVRRTLAAGSGRWLLYPVVAVMAVAAVGGAAETVGLAADQHAYAMPGRLYDVGGHRLHLDCTGSGGPTVVLLSGLGGSSASWARIAPAVADTTRVCAYDRAGQGWSDAAAPQNGVAAAADLHTLLARAGEQGPYVLVGHSIGGDYAMTYADRYPEQVAGMVLLDTTSPYRTAAGTMRAGSLGPFALLPSVARLGVGRLFPTSTWSALPDPEASRFAAFVTSPRGLQNTVDEMGTMPALLDEAQQLSSLGSTPLVVLTAEGHESDAAWNAAQDRMAALSTNSSHRQGDTGHGGLLDEAAGAQQSTSAIDDVVRAVRGGMTLEPS
jgi:pimeloyl-ACP methyl ester carboxylesterase